jgi:hypothetical protein
MSSGIWTQCAGDSEIRRIALTAWRVVEAQHLFSTRKLVDSAEEQMLLEELLERSKPPGRAPARLHYLLSTPFRYPPLPHGSRFGTRFQTGIWYGSTTERTAFAEVAFYRLAFLEATAPALGALTTVHTSFSAHVRTSRGIDLTVPPFAKHRATIASPSKYGETQALGAAMRAAGVQLVRYPSARDRDGINTAVLAPEAFGASQPRHLETWHGIANHDGVEFLKRSYFGTERHFFPRAQFLVKGALPWPAR